MIRLGNGGDSHPMRIPLRGYFPCMDNGMLVVSCGFVSLCVFWNRLCQSAYTLLNWEMGVFVSLVVGISSQGTKHG